MAQWRTLVEDERGALSSARTGMWATVLVAYVSIGVDLYLVLTGGKHFVPNTVYGVLGTMFLAFASWAAGPRIAQYLGPQIGAVAQGLGAATRTDAPPTDHETMTDREHEVIGA